MTIYLSENIKRLRRERELTQETIAEFLGVSFQSVSNWERGESYPDITMLPEIAGFFKVSVDDLLGVNQAENEAEITKELEAYDNLSDENLKQEIINKLREKFPNDFRVLLRFWQHQAAWRCAYRVHSRAFCRHFHCDNRYQLLRLEEVHPCRHEEEKFCQPVFHRLMR